MEISFLLNETPVSVEAKPTDRLLDILRDVLEYKGTKEGCGIGECGACTVIMDGKTVNSCITLMVQVDGKNITTIEGLRDKPLANLLKKHFAEEGAVQCGFCTPGMILSAYVLLTENTSPSLSDIKTALSGNLCRCTGYIPIISAVKKAARAWKKSHLQGRTS